MINYSLNISKWVKQYLPNILRKPNRIGILIGLVAPLKWFYDEFNSFREFVYLRIGYNSQQRSLAYLLNKVFETGTLIKVKTISDTTKTYYAFDGVVPVGFEQVYSDATPLIYASAGKPRLQGEIIAPATLITKEGEIRAWVNNVVFADKNYTVTFI